MPSAIRPDRKGGKILPINDLLCPSVCQRYCEPIADSNAHLAFVRSDEQDYPILAVLVPDNPMIRNGWEADTKTVVL